MKILIILGSIRQPSLTRILAERAATAYADRGMSVDWVDPRARPLPIADPNYHHDVADTPDANVRTMVRQVAEANGIVLASPLYHGSFSGVLKNAIDSLSFDAFRDKPVGLLSHGNQSKRCAQPCEHLLPVVRTIYGIALQTQVASCKGDFSKNSVSGEITLIDGDTTLRCERQADEMIAYLIAQKVGA
ncbi:NADPH-dependent FMN reductase [Acidithiobacillus ferrianus]|uniref:FMN reductase n=2 Tax=Acidithiobacillus ferrianus TaxID=2678518 RepID=A0A845U5M8_9PROT|nr:NADPH-dependent FMN reductase [Acidithiobacillus ferrianus]NDU42183.1 FMN reductase [Acidithiobacillus ferrianus]